MAGFSNVTGSRLVFRNNTVGSSTIANSLNASSPSTDNAQRVVGFQMDASFDSLVVSNNTIANLTNGTTSTNVAVNGVVNGIADLISSHSIISNNTIFNLNIANANNSATHLASAAGIALNKTMEIAQISGNTIYNIHNNLANFTGRVHGIYLFGIGGTLNNTIQSNFIHNLRINGATAVNASVIGVRLAAGTVLMSNNIISIGNNCTSQVIGVREEYTTNHTVRILFNTIYIQGTTTHTAALSYALYSHSTISFREFNNNILFNARTNTAGSGQHYAIFYNYSATTGLTSVNHNNYFVTGTGGVLGSFAAINRTSLAELQSATSQDQSSLVVNPQLVNPLSAIATNFTPQFNRLIGSSSFRVPVDFLGQTRANPSTIGALEIILLHQVEVWISGSLVRSYITLFEAFNRINDGTHQGSIELRINSSTNESSSAVLRQSGFNGVSNYSSVVIFPTVAGVSISGAGGALIDLNGATNVTIDGRVNRSGSVRSMSVINSNIIANAQTIRMQNAATNIRIAYCILRGASGGTTGGVVVVLTSTGSTGNSNITIEHNTITNDTDANRPSVGFRSLGTTGLANDGLIISNNSFENITHRTANNRVIELNSNNSNALIANNSIYETSPLVTTGENTTTFIQVHGANHVISGNFIGGTAPNAGGAPLVKTGSAHAFNGILVDVTPGSVTHVDGNVISNIHWTNTSTLNSTFIHFNGINAVSGDVNIGVNAGNRIGAETGSESIIFTEGSQLVQSFRGINIASLGIVNCHNNVIGAITTNHLTNRNNSFFGIHVSGGTGNKSIMRNSIQHIVTAALSENNTQTLYAIFASGTASGNMIISNNTIQHLNNATIASAGFTGVVHGISLNAGSTDINGNTISNLSIANSNTSSLHDVSAAGISINTTLSTNVLRNTIFNIVNTNLTFAGNVYGIYFAGSTPVNRVETNFIHSLGVTGANSTLASVMGIRAQSGVTNYINNIIALGGNTRTRVVGIWDEGALNQNIILYHNTVYLWGTLPSSVNITSFAFLSNAALNTKDIRNNILFNARSTPGVSNVHYVISLTASTNVTSTHNNLMFSGTGGALGLLNSINRNTLRIWQTASGLDVNSKSIDPQFATPAGTTPLSYVPAHPRLYATSGIGVLTDFSGASRMSRPTMGALEGNLSVNHVEVHVDGVFAQVYFNLREAFDRINDGTHVGNQLQLRIIGNTEEDATAVLYQSGFNGMSSYNQIDIFPTVAGLSVFGTLPAPLIDLNGASRVTINGSVNGTGSDKSLTLHNASVSGVDGTSTLRFINNASSNRVTNSIIRGAATSASSGVVFFSTAGGATGTNEDNVIENNDITSSTDADRAVNSVFSSGTSGRPNRGITIRNNHFYNFLNRGNASNGIRFGSETTSSMVEGNSFFETASFIPTSSVEYAVIRINPAATGNDFTVQNNVIGGQAPNAGGAAWTKTNATNNPISAILMHVGTGTPSMVNGNRISNIHWSNSTTGNFTGISVSAGDVNVGTVVGNVIGSGTGTGSIVFTTGSAGVSITGIHITSVGVVHAHNNTIGSITALNSSANNSTNFNGILITGSTGQKTITGNTIGSTTTLNSVLASSSSAANVQSVFGIRNGSTTTVTIEGNTVANLTNATTNTNTASAGNIVGVSVSGGTGSIVNNRIYNLSIANANTASNENASAIGIARSGLGTTVVQRNTLFNIVNTNPTFAGFVYGLFVAVNNTVEGNFIQGLSATGGSATTAQVMGIRAQSGVATYSNNIIHLGDNSPNTFYGIFDVGASGQTFNLYHNTVQLSGSPTVGSSGSFALYSNANSNTRNIRNNLFINTRTNAGSSVGQHYAAFFNYATVGALALNNNNYVASGSGGRLGRFNSLDVLSLPLIAGFDGGSVSVAPLFVDVLGTLPEHFRPARWMQGVTIAGFATDFGGATRSVFPTMGAWEAILNRWRGTVSNHWGTAANWTLNRVPANGEDIIFDSNPLNHCVLDVQRSVGSIVNHQSVFRVVVPAGLRLNIAGQLLLVNGARIEAQDNSVLRFNGATTQSIPSEALWSNQLYGLEVDNPGHLVLNGTISIRGVLNAINGRFNAIAGSPTITFSGSVPKTVSGNHFVNQQIHRLDIRNSISVLLTDNMHIVTHFHVITGICYIDWRGRLTVSGSIFNSDAHRLVIISNYSGTGSLIHNTPNVPATVQRFFGGNREDWHFLSSPVVGQSISGEWTPIGDRWDGLGYDLFVWDEYYACWVFDRVDPQFVPVWDDVHPSTDFTTGRGYLYSLDDDLITKHFRGQLHAGLIEIDLTTAGGNQYQGFNFIGNPYPSSIDWKMNSGFSRWMLDQHSGGFDMWIWNPQAGNYGVYNSGSVMDTGTNGVTRYIPSMQGFFVRATQQGTFQFFDAARTHEGSDAWMMPSEEKWSVDAFFLRVLNPSNERSDEIQLNRRTGTREGGARKLFSHDPVAPSLFVSDKTGHYSVFDKGQSSYIDVSFRPGIEGEFEFSWRDDQWKTGTLVLEDRLLRTKTDLSRRTTYRFTASPNDKEARFRLHFVSPGAGVELRARVYSESGYLKVDLTELTGEYLATITDISGKMIQRVTLQGGAIHPYRLAARGVYFVHLRGLTHPEEAGFKVIH